MLALVEGDQLLDPEVQDSSPKNDDNGKSDEANPENTSSLMRKLLSALERQQRPLRMGDHLGTVSTMSV